MAKLKPNMSWIGHTIGDRYKIEALLGQGGMSAVYQAIDPNLQRTVAVKLIHPHLSSDAEFVRRFEREAAAVAQLRHPNIIQVYDFNHDDQLYYMVMEYVPGQTLRDKLSALNAAGQRLPIADTIRIMTTICKAVAYAHEQGMIHRDLKPPNVMLTPKGEPILMDFGVAKMLGGTQHTATGAIIGTAKYMSPEQARGEHPDERSDIYALGVMLYEMVAGQPPFEADTSVAVLMKHVTQPVPDIRELQSNTPERLVAVIERALAKNAEDRYQRAADMAAALQTIDLRAEAIDSTMAQPFAPRTRSGTRPSLPKSAPGARPASKAAQPVLPIAVGRRLLWIIPVAIIVLILILGLGVFFAFFARPGQAPAGGGEEALAQAEDSTLPLSTGMVRIPAGTYFVGLDPADRDHAPTQQVDLAEFWIDQYETTNAQYSDFLTTTNRQPPEDWPEGNIPPDQADHPVKGITWELAAAYCQWAKKRLPSEAEWEVAARGPERRLYPWGDDQRAVQLPRSGTYPVGSKLTNQSPFGVFDMAGNVWEWVGETYAPITEGHRVLRGGTNGFLKDMAYRLEGDPSVPTMFAAAGVRCAADRVNIVPAETVQEADILYQDGFADPGSGWPILAEEDAFFGYHPPDYYHVEVSRPEDHTVVSRPPNFENVTVETQVLVDHTDTDNGDFRYGLALRRSGDQYYAFTVSPRHQAWYVLKSSAAGLQTLAEGPIETLQGIAPQGSTPDKTDALRVDANGSTFVFLINGQPVVRVDDSDYASGEVGFYVETFDETLAHIHYDALTIRKVKPEEINLLPAATATAEPPTPPPTSASESDTLPTATPEPPPPTPEPEEATATPEPPGPASGSVPPNMVLIPAGTFLMGSSNGQPDEAPEHQVSLSAYAIDRYEVSNGEYRRCVDAGGCTQAGRPDSFTRPGYRDDPAFDNYPVMGVTWDQAEAYCRWAGKRLPSEAEWEYAASGPENLTWPWGNTFDPNLSAASAPDLQPVDSYADGASPFGLYNMAGNVAEWVQDVFVENFYANSPAQNPVSSGNGNDRIYRGGAFDNRDGAFYTTSRRYVRARSFNDVDIGFRCAADVN